MVATAGIWARLWHAGYLACCGHGRSSRTEGGQCEQLSGVAQCFQLWASNAPLCGSESEVGGGRKAPGVAFHLLATPLKAEKGKKAGAAQG